MSRPLLQDIIFGRSLREPGYRVDFAVGSTYSLDLDTFISLPFSLGFLEEPDEVMKKSVPYIFSALRLCSDRLAVFCNFSDIKVPPQSRKVYYALMEESIFPVNAGNDKRIVNFHPKVWVVKQTSVNGQDSLIRVIVMSRNLTRDGDLDCACVLTGKIGRGTPEGRKKHKPLADFLLYLRKKANGPKRARIESLANDLLLIDRFDVAGSVLDDYDFLPMGIPDYSGMKDLEYMSRSARCVVVSPFLDDTTVSRFGECTEKLLITQETSITDSMVNAFGRENIYTIAPQMIDNDLGESVNLHAKMYFTHGPRRGVSGWKNNLYLGSTNATVNGFDRNVEFLVCLQFAPYKTSWWTFASLFKEDPGKRFIPMVDVMEPDQGKGEEYRRTIALRRAIAAIKKAMVNPDGEFFSITLFVGEGEMSASVYPLLRPDLKAPLCSGISFKGMSLIELSEFYVIEAEGLSRVVKVPTEGIPSDRDDMICRSVITSKAQFMDCISFLLSENKTAYVVAQEYSKLISGDAGEGSSGRSFPAVYESILREAYESPDTFEDIRTFVNSLPQDVVPADFHALYKKVVKAIKGFRR